MKVNNVPLLGPNEINVDYSILAKGESTGIFSFSKKSGKLRVKAKISDEDFNRFLKEAMRMDIVNKVEMNQYEQACPVINAYFEKYGDTLNLTDIPDEKLSKLTGMCYSVQKAAGTDVKCVNSQDYITQEEFSSNTVYKDNSNYLIILGGVDATKGYCWERETLLQWLEHAKVYGNWSNDKAYWSEEQKETLPKFYKLSQPDVWIDQNSLSAIKIGRVLQTEQLVNPDGTSKMEVLGRESALEIGTLHDREFPVYTLRIIEADEKLMGGAQEVQPEQRMDVQPMALDFGGMSSIDEGTGDNTINETLGDGGSFMSDNEGTEDGGSELNGTFDDTTEGTEGTTEEGNGNGQ